MESTGRKKIISLSSILAPLVLGMVFLPSCGGGSGQKSEGNSPQPTNTPAFKLTPIIQMAFPNPWDRTQPENIRPPVYPAPSDLRLQIYDSSYNELISFLAAKLNPGSEFTLPANFLSKHGMPLPPGPYYLVISTSFGTWVDQFQLK